VASARKLREALLRRLPAGGTPPAFQAGGEIFVQLQPDSAKAPN